METKQIIIRDAQQGLTDAFRQTAIKKIAPLFRHDINIESVCIDLEIDPTCGPAGRFVAKGRLEVDGPNLVASVRSENAYKSIDLLVQKFDVLLPASRA